MAFTLTINTDNAAFTDSPGWEIARILRLTADCLTLSDIPLNSYEKHLIRDYNGNTVGAWEYTPARLEWECFRCRTINEEEDTEPGTMTCVDCGHTVDSAEAV